MGYGLYRIRSGTLAAISVASVGGIVLAVVPHRRRGVPLARSIWTALVAVSAAGVLLFTLTPTGTCRTAIRALERRLPLPGPTAGEL